MQDVWFCRGIWDLEDYCPNNDGTSNGKEHGNEMERGSIYDIIVIKTSQRVRTWLAVMMYASRHFLG